MKIQIFDVAEGVIKPHENCYIVPELKAVMEAYPDPIPALSFLYGMKDPSSPYLNVPEHEKEETIWADYPGDYTSEDEVIIEALKKLDKLYETPTLRFFKDCKVSLEKLGRYLATATITDGRDGNLAAYSVAQTRMGKTMEDFKKIEKQVELENEEYTTRGGIEEAYDM